MENYNGENRNYNFDPLTGERLTPPSEDEIKTDSFYDVDPAEVSAQTFESEAQTETENPSAPEDKKSKKKEKEKKPMGFGKRVAAAIAIAVVFGLVAGTVFYGVNYFGNRYIKSNQAMTENQESASAENIKAIEKEEKPAAEIPSENSKPEKQDVIATTEPTGSAAANAQGTVADVAANCMPSLVTIASLSTVEMQNFFGMTEKYEAQGSGSGVIVGMNDTELLIATNNHVVSGAKELSVGFINETSVEAYIKGTDEENDLAVVAVKLENIPEETLSQLVVATIGNSEELVLGEQVVAIGNALGNGLSVTSGYVSALNRDMDFSDGNYAIHQTCLIQTDAPINSGNSGGGLFNMKGELVGINEAKSSMTASGTTVDGVGYAISIDKAKPILENLMSLETKETVPEDKQGYLGVTCANVTSDIASMYDMPEGVCFTSVLEGSPAAEAGIEKGDVLIEFDGVAIDSYESLKTELSYHMAGDTVEMKIMRFSNGEYEEMTLNITLGTYESIQNLSQNG